MKNKDFRQTGSDNKSLMQFFAFSILFVALVVAGLFACAALTRGILVGQSWISGVYHSFLDSL